MIWEITHAKLPCPARRLEVVVYSETETRSPRKELEFLMNFNTGEELDRDVMVRGTGKIDESMGKHWFLLDLDMGEYVLTIEIDEWDIIPKFHVLTLNLE